MRPSILVDQIRQFESSIPFFCQNQVLIIIMAKLQCLGLSEHILLIISPSHSSSKSRINMEVFHRRSALAAHYTALYAPSSMDQHTVARVQNLNGVGALYLCRRPYNSPGLARPLLHPAFGKFLVDIRDASLPTRDDYAFVREFCIASPTFYKKEADRQWELQTLLGKIGCM